MNPTIFIFSLPGCLLVITLVLAHLDYSRAGFYCQDGKKFCFKAGRCFDPNHQECCGRSVLNTSDGRCCTTKSGSAHSYQPYIEACCGGKVVPFAQGKVATDYICCGEKLRLITDGICCGDEWQGALDATYKEKARCCGRELYNPANQICCKQSSGVHYLHKVHPRGEHSRCCGTDTYNESTHWCYDHVYDVYDVYQNDESLCGNRKIKRTNQICCQGTVHNRGEQDQVCCLDQVYNKTGNWACCGSDYHNPATEECCDREVINRQAKKSKMCCQNTIQDIPDPDNPKRYKCCDTITMDTTIHKCHRGKPISVRNRPCEGDVNVNCYCQGMKLTDDQICCLDRITKKGMGDNQCCQLNSNTAQAYNNNTHVCRLDGLGIQPKPMCKDDELTSTTECCHGKVYPKDDDTNPCRPSLCNGSSFEPMFQLCCGNTLFNRVDGAHCCGAARYSKTANQSCCGIHIIEPDSGEKCCNAFVPYKTSEFVCSRKKLRPDRGIIGPYKNRQKCRPCNKGHLKKIDSWNIHFCELKTVIQAEIGTLITRGKRTFVELLHIHVVRFQQRHRTLAKHPVWLRLPKKCQRTPPKGEKIIFMTNKNLKRSNKGGTLQFFFKYSRKDYIGLDSVSLMRKMQHMTRYDCTLLQSLLEVKPRV